MRAMASPTGPLFDPELVPLLEFFPEVRLSAQVLPVLRASIAQLAANASLPQRLPVSVEERRVPGAAGMPDVRSLLYLSTRAAPPLPVLFHMHGGGYVLGAPEINADTHRVLAAELDCAIVSVDYRLAPETPHPGPIEDCYAALRWTHAHAGELGIDASRIGVFGESAGGGLAAALALLARDRREIPLRFQHLIYPMLDDRTCTHADPHPHAGQHVWTAEHNHFGWQSLLGAAPGADGVSAYAAAGRAQDLGGLPPAFIAVGALDLFLEENLEYARRLTRAGVPVELHVYPGAPHAFQMVTGARVSVAAERDSVSALRRALHG